MPRNLRAELGSILSIAAPLAIPRVSQRIMNRAARFMLGRISGAALAAGGLSQGLIGMPTAAILARQFNFGVVGIWFGLFSGISRVAIMLLWRWRRGSIPALTGGQRATVASAGAVFVLVDETPAEYCQSVER